MFRKISFFQFWPYFNYWYVIFAAPVVKKILYRWISMKRSRKIYLLVEFLHFDIGKKVFFGEFLLHQTLFVTLYCKYMFVYMGFYWREKKLCRKIILFIFTNCKLWIATSSGVWRPIVRASALCWSSWCWARTFRQCSRSAVSWNGRWFGFKRWVLYVSIWFLKERRKLNTACFLYPFTNGSLIYFTKSFRIRYMFRQSTLWRISWLQKFYISCNISVITKTCMYNPVRFNFDYFFKMIVMSNITDLIFLHNSTHLM